MGIGRSPAHRLTVWSSLIFLALLPSARISAQPPAEGGKGQPAAPASPAFEVRQIEGEATQAPAGSSTYLGVQEAVRLAIAHNPDLRAAGFLPLRADEDIVTVEGKNDPVAYGKGTYTEVEYPTNTPTLTGTKQKLFSGSLGWKQYLTTGTAYDLSWDSSYSWTDFSFVTLNPTYRTDFALSITQPLLKGFGLAVNRAPAEMARSVKEATDIQYRSQAEDLVQKVTETYWDLVLAREIASVKVSSLELAHNLAGSIDKQVQSGLLAALELYKAQAVEATREEEVLLARKGAKDVEDLLKGLITGPTPGEASFWDREIVPVDRPEEGEVQISLEEDLERALKVRDEVLQAEADRKAKVEGLRIATNALLPSVNLLGSLKLNGLSGRGLPSGVEKSCVGAANPQKCEDALSQLLELFGFGSTQSDPEFVGDYFTAFSTLQFLTWYVGLNVEYPIGNNAAESKYKQALIDLDRSASLLVSVRDKVRMDVREAARRLDTNRQRLATTASASRFAEKSLRDEQKKFDGGYSTSANVLTGQKDLAEARSAELKAKADYAKAILKYRVAVGRLLDESGIRPPVPQVRHFDAPSALW